MIEKIVLLIIKVNNINFWPIVGRTLLACTKKWMDKKFSQKISYNQPLVLLFNSSGRFFIMGEVMIEKYCVIDINR